MGLLQRPNAGKIYFQGEEASREKTLAIRRRMASVFQEPLLLNASVYDNAALGLKLRGLHGADIRQRLKPWLERLGIGHLTSRRVQTLSGGELQRTSLARAFVLDPALLLLDEPFSALDPLTRESLLFDLQDILKQTGVTTVFVTHDRDEAFMLGSRVGVLREGKLLQVGTNLEVFTRPVEVGVAEIVGADTRIPAVVETASEGESRIGFDGGAARVIGNFQPGAPVILCIRPEDITVSRPGRESVDSSASNELKVTLLKAVPSAVHCRLVLQCGSSLLIAFVSRALFLDLGIREGDELIAFFNTAAAHVMMVDRRPELLGQLRVSDSGDDPGQFS
jgi:tungstate transport system ATP-binding protein